MQNFLEDGLTITAVAGGTITSGSPVLIGGILAVPVTSAASGQSYVAYVEGVFSVAKAAEAITQGDRLYWDAGNARLAMTPGTDSKPLVAFAWAGAALDAATVQARLVPTMATGPSA